MKNKECRFIPPAIVVFLLGSLLVGCAANSDGPPLDDNPVFVNPVFPNAELILVGDPAFDTIVDVTPDFAWEATGRKLVFLGIFTGRIIIDRDDYKVSNRDDCLWAWHSGLGTGREGWVVYSDGVDVRGGILASADADPAPLESGKSYYWAVWAWDETGLAVTHASREMYFTVE